MKTIRPVYLEKCSLCGKECDKLTMYEIFTGRTKYICRECKTRGNREMDARVGRARASSRAKAAEEMKRRK